MNWKPASAVKVRLIVQFLKDHIGDRHGGQISVPGAQAFKLLFFFQLDCIQTKKPESSFIELSDFFTGDTYRASRDTL